MDICQSCQISEHQSPERIHSEQPGESRFEHMADLTACEIVTRRLSRTPRSLAAGLKGMTEVITESVSIEVSCGVNRLILHLCTTVWGKGNSATSLPVEKQRKHLKQSH